MNERTLVIVASLSLMMAVAAGAFGAHGLQNTVSPTLLGVWHTAVLYHLIHGLGLLFLAWASSRYGGRVIATAGWFMLAGIVLFSGSLYALVLSGTRLLGAITPLGGLAFILAWALLAWAAWKAR